MRVTGQPVQLISEFQVESGTVSGNERTIQREIWSNPLPPHTQAEACTLAWNTQKSKKEWYNHGCGQGQEGTVRSVVCENVFKVYLVDKAEGQVCFG